jgi:hypothetical protein
MDGKGEAWERDRREGEEDGRERRGWQARDTGNNKKIVRFSPRDVCSIASGGWTPLVIIRNWFVGEEFKVDEVKKVANRRIAKCVV